MGFAAKTFYGCEAKKKTNNNSQCSKETSIGDKMVGRFSSLIRLISVQNRKTMAPDSPLCS